MSFRNCPRIAGCGIGSNSWEARDDRKHGFWRTRLAFRGGIGGLRIHLQIQVAAEAQGGPAKGKGGVHVQLQDATGKSIARAEAGPGKSNAAVLID